MNSPGGCEELVSTQTVCRRLVSWRCELVCDDDACLSIRFVVVFFFFSVVVRSGDRGTDRGILSRGGEE